MDKKISEVKKQKINRAVYGLLATVVAVSIIIFFVYQYENRTRQYHQSVAHNYHLAMAEKASLLLSVIDKSKLMFHELDETHGDVSKVSKKYVSLVHINFSKHDQVIALINDIKKITSNMLEIQDRYSVHEFESINESLKLVQSRVISELDLFLNDGSMSGTELDNMLFPLISVTHQLQLLHKVSYENQQKILTESLQAKKFQVLGLVLVLIVIGAFGVTRILRQVNKALKELTKAEYELESQEIIINQIHDSVISTDFSGHVVSWNKGSEVLLGFTREDMLGKHISSIYPLELHEYLNNELIPSLIKNGSYETETRLLTKTKEVISVNLSFSLLRDENKKPVGMIGYALDITKRKKAENELSKHRLHLEELIGERTWELTQARDEAENANTAKSEFLSRMSHELRTPLNAILGFSQMLELDAEKLTSTQRSNVQEIYDAGNHLLNLINEVLDLSKIESGTTEIIMQDIELKGVLKDSLKLMIPQLTESQIEIIDEVSDFGDMVYADTTQLKQVFLNLLSNAVKYNMADGRITIGREVISDELLRISVSDSGEGISEEDIRKLFTPFERLNAVNNVEGTGIGLVITKKLIEGMGGSIGVDSEKGKGSTFWVQIALSKNN